MELLYKAFACEEMDGKKLLLPGFPVHPDMKRLKEGNKIKVELADGTFLETTAQATKPLYYEKNMALKLRLRVDTGFYIAIEVPNNFSVPGIELGANVYLIDS